jgi:hypothetical protein
VRRRRRRSCRFHAGIARAVRAPRALRFPTPPGCPPPAGVDGPWVDLQIEPLRRFGAKPPCNRSPRLPALSCLATATPRKPLPGRRLQLGSSAGLRGDAGVHAGRYPRPTSLTRSGCVIRACASVAMQSEQMPCVARLGSARWCASFSARRTQRDPSEIRSHQAQTRAWRVGAVTSPLRSRGCRTKGTLQVRGAPSVRRQPPVKIR